GSINTDALREAIFALDEAVWTENEYRQQAYREHSDTQSVVLLFTNSEGWPNIEVTKENGWDLLSEHVVPIMDKLLDEHYPPGGTIIRAMIANLTAGGVIKTHVDGHPSFHAGHRIHIPITTNARVRFMINGKPNQLKVGKAYEINNQKTHSVMNKGKEDRLTLIFDYVPADHEQFNPTFVDNRTSAK
ncbi:MAG: aspartyl/asparaginyl beta-hydroxylase domain-containing protein, partial [Emcibacteraceae bacterium]|nr:aspartyl/asparaginyl beta-hydroxylase domain-containing protein [Emcibacteraceae bacterium]